MGWHILFVGKSDSILDPIWPRLEARGMGVTLAASQRTAIELARQHSPDLIIVDGTASRSCHRLCRSLRHISPHSAVILLADEHGLPDDIPCDVRLSKPFTARKLIARIEKVLEQHVPKLLQVGSLILDPATRTVQGARGEQKLTPKECAILVVLMENAGRVVSRQQLMRSIWDTSYVGDTRTLEVHIHWLRKKIEVDPKAPQLIMTVRGQGYRLNVVGA
jgi:DNA-binding response OmpR family regulator